MSPRVVAAFCAGVLIGLGAGLQLAPSPPTSSPGLSPRVDDVRPAAREEAHLPAVESLSPGPSNRVAVDTQESEPVEGGVDPTASLAESLDRPAPREVPTDAELEAMFGRLSLTELDGARKAFMYLMHAEAQPYLEEKFERGLYRVEIVPRGTPLPEGGLHPDGTPRPTARHWIPMPDGQVEARTAELHLSEVPGMDARLAEVRWISRRIRTLRDAAEQDPGGDDG